MTLLDTSPPIAERSQPDPRSSGGDRMDVILVDDDHRTSRIAADILEEDGVCVHAYSTAAPALERARDGGTDLVIVDLELPDMTGFEVTRQLREDDNTCHLPVLVVSGHRDPRSRTAAYAAGADCFLGKPFTVDELRAIVWSLGHRGRLLKDVEGGEAVLYALAEIVDLRCLDARGHMERSARLAGGFGRLLGLSAVDVRALERGGYLHDIGKVGIPFEVLHKEGPLTPPERKIMEQHPLLGARICEHLLTLRPVLPIIRHHHERYDGSGYPHGLAGEAIPRLARVFQVVDVYEALISRRCYKQPMSGEAALEILRNEARRGWWDPDLVQLFTDAVERGLMA